MHTSMRTLHSLAACVLAVAVSAAGCSDATGPSEASPGAHLNLLVTAGGGQAGSPALSPSLTVEDSGDELVISRVAVVLRDIELELQFDDCPEDDGSRSDDACEKFVAGPMLLDLELDGDAEQLVTVEVPPGIYDELEFEIHKPDDDTEADREFLRDHPDFEDVSIRVEGTWNGEEFVFLQDLNEDQELALSPPLEITDGTTTRNLTLRLDLATWFRTPDGGLVDPRTASDGGPNEDLVEENIERSIEAFQDEDGDGRED